MRSAHAAIKGYEYQFDRTIVELLAASSDAVIHIEGIEDIDLLEAGMSQATQVKYYESQRYTSPKSLRDPVKLMLDHYRTGARWEYVLHVHFGDPGDLPSTFTLDQMKACLTKRDGRTGRETQFFGGLDDAALRDFCDRVAIRHGESFAEQQTALIASLADALECSIEEALAIYIAKAREFVRERAINADPEARKVSRADLLDFLAVKELLYSRWQLSALGRERFLSGQAAHLKRFGFADKQRVRGVAAVLTNANFNSMLEFAQSAAGAHSGRLKNAKPWTLILGGEADLVFKLKVELVRSGVHFNDGYESIEFSADVFATPPVINLVGAGDRLKVSSYVLRVITDTNFQTLAIERWRLARLIVLGEKAAWHETSAEVVYVLKEYEPGLFQALMGAII